jgi:hypothetical protein
MQRGYSGIAFFELIFQESAGDFASVGSTNLASNSVAQDNYSVQLTTGYFCRFLSSGPLGKFANTQSRATGPKQDALRWEWHALSKKYHAELAQ